MPYLLLLYLFSTAAMGFICYRIGFRNGVRSGIKAAEQLWPAS